MCSLVSLGDEVLGREKKKLTSIDRQKQDGKREVAQPQHHNLIDELPVVGEFLGNVSLGCGFEYNYRSTNRSLRIEQAEPAPRCRWGWYQWFANRRKIVWNGIYFKQHSF